MGGSKIMSFDPNTATIFDPNSANPVEGFDPTSATLMNASEIRKISNASKNKNFVSPNIQSSNKMQIDNKTIQDAPRIRNADPVTKGIIEGLSMPILAIHDELSKSSDQIASGQVSTGLLGLGQTALHTVFTPFTVPFGAVMGGLKGSGQIGRDISQGLEQTLNLPFDAIKEASAGVGQIAGSVGIDLQGASDLFGHDFQNKANEFMTELGGLYAFKKAHDISTSTVNKTSGTLPTDLRQPLNIGEQPRLTEFRPKENITQPIEGLTQEKDLLGVKDASTPPEVKADVPVKDEKTQIETRLQEIDSEVNNAKIVAGGKNVNIDMFALSRERTQLETKLGELNTKEKNQTVIDLALERGDNPKKIAKTLDVPIEDIKHSPKIEETKPSLEPTDITVPDQTSIKNAVVNQERVDRGLSPIEKGASKSNESVNQSAINQVKTDQIDPRQLAKDIVAKPEDVELSTVKEAALLNDKEVIRKDWNDIKEQLSQTADVNKQAELKAKQLLLENDLNINEQATTFLSSEAGRALQYNQRMQSTDNSLLGVLQKARDANKGRELPITTKERITNLVDQRDEQVKKISELEGRISQLEAQKNLKRINGDIQLNIRREGRKAKVEDIDKHYNSLVAEFAKTIKLNALVDPIQVKLMAEMVKDQVMKGLVKAEDIVDVLYNDLSKYMPDLTKRDILDAIGGYGKFKELNKDEINVQLRDVRRQSRLLSALDDINNKIVPLKSGLERDKLTARAKELTRLVNEGKKKAGMDIEPSQKAYETRLKNREQELKTMLDTGNFTKTPKRKLELTPEIQLSKDKVDHLSLLVKKEIQIIERANRTTGQKIADMSIDIANIPKAVMASVDLSAAFRQGLPLVPGHPVLTFKKGGAFREMFHYFGSEKHFQGLIKNIESDPNYDLYVKTKLHITEGNSGKIGAREEAFIAHLPEKVPFVGSFLIKGSDRAFTGFLYKLRKDVFDAQAIQLEKSGLTFKTDPEVFKGLASYINNGSGRGNLRSSAGEHLLSAIAPVTNIGFFSTRLIVSRLQLLNPIYYAKLDAPIRRLAIKDMLSFVAAGSSLLAIARLNGGSVELDPRSADFAKIKTGNTRIDIWGGFQQYVTLATRLATNEAKTQNGKVRTSKEYPYTTRLQRMEDFTYNKLSPAAGMIKRFLQDQAPDINDKSGFQPTQEAINSLTPLYLKDLYETIQEQGAVKGLALGIPPMFGVGMSNYKPPVKKGIFQGFKPKQFKQKTF